MPELMTAAAGSQSPPLSNSSFLMEYIKKAGELTGRGVAAVQAKAEREDWKGKVLELAALQL